MQLRISYNSDTQVKSELWKICENGGQKSTKYKRNGLKVLFFLHQIPGVHGELSSSTTGATTTLFQVTLNRGRINHSWKKILLFCLIVFERVGLWQTETETETETETLIETETERQ